MQKFLKESHNKKLLMQGQQNNLSARSPRQQEEAETQIMLHLHHAAEQGHTTIYLVSIATFALTDPCLHPF
jgi:hypothetical protein